MLTLPSQLFASEHRLYSLVRLGSLVNSINDINDVQIASLVVGFRVDTALYVEAELNKSVSGGEFVSEGENGKFTISNLNLNGAYRYMFNDRVYGKLKTGIAYNSLEYQISNSEGYNSTEEGLSATAGIGLGFVLFLPFLPAKQVMVEIEYVNIDKDINMITIGTTSLF